MTIINPNSIAGITSITSQGNNINFYRSDGTLAGLELGGVNFYSTSGVSTFSSIHIGNDIRISSGIVTATTFSGALTGNVTGNATGLSGTPNITVGTISATSINASGISTFGSSNGIGTVTVGVGTTALLVQGNARVTGIFKIGEGSVTIDGNTGILSATSGLGFGGDPQGDRVLSFHSKSGDVGYGGSNVGSGVFRVSGPAQNLSWPGLAVGLIDGPAGGSGTYGLVGGNGSYIIGENITATQRSSLGIATASSLNVSGISTFAGITTVTGETLFSKQLNVSGITTSTGGFVGNVTGNATGLSGTPNITVGTIGATSLNASGIVTATGGFNLGISSAGTSITSGPVTALNFIGTGNTFAVNGSTVDISIAGGGGSVGGGGTFSSNSVGVHTTKILGINTTTIAGAANSEGALQAFGNVAVIDGALLTNQNIDSTIFIPSNRNGLLIGPVTVGLGVTIDIASGCVLVIV